MYYYDNVIVDIGTYKRSQSSLVIEIWRMASCFLWFMEKENNCIVCLKFPSRTAYYGPSSFILRGLYPAVNTANIPFSPNVFKQMHLLFQN